MKKNFDYRMKSGVQCSQCGKLLKLNLVEHNPKADRCYKCYKGTTGRNVNAGVDGAEALGKN